MKSAVFLIIALLLLGTANVYADPPKPNVFDDGNLWAITAYDDSSPVHLEWATQGICFLPPVMIGTHLRGQWYSTTFPDWNGIYSQEGDQLFMHGDYARDVGHDGITIEIFSQKEGGGSWTEWREDGGIGRTIGFANARMQRLGKCRIIQSTDLPNLFVPPRFLLNGKEAESPLDRDQVPIDLFPPQAPSGLSLK